MRISEVLRRRRVPATTGDYYPTQATCQVSHLAALYRRFLGEREDGTFVEVGANDGIFVSNTWGLAERGWRGLMVEPVPAFAATCRRNHDGHPNVTVVECAVGAEDDTTVILHIAGTLTTGNSEAFQEYGHTDWAVASLTDEQITVPGTRLDTLLEQQRIHADFDVLVVDVEGFEEQVFAGFTLDRWRPRMMIVELLDTHPDLSTTAVRDGELGQRLLSTGYVTVYKDDINTVFVRKDVYWDALRAVSGETTGG